MTTSTPGRTQTVDLLISHSQILVRSRPYDEARSRWGHGNVEQGATLHADYLVFDPLPDEAFGAVVHLAHADAFSPDPKAQRRIVAPFALNDPAAVEVASAAEAFPVEVGLVAGIYDVFFEICESDEVYYRFTFVPNAQPGGPRFLLDDEWGGEEGNALRPGLF